ncbi:MAG TPA: periplasmic nitrate reductase, NapE protein [Burkholderiales bacterium]|jgi:periplasmic nitrate reductase NapE|nr:periplasmic nitrate reductase, NapE protein [Burkholderiales bacterium]
MVRTSEQPTAAQELGTLLVVTGIVVPLLAIAVVGGFGFIVWMYQVIAGPPVG